MSSTCRACESGCDEPHSCDLDDKLDAALKRAETAEAREKTTQKLYQSWHERALKAERIIKDMFLAR